MSLGWGGGLRSSHILSRRPVSTGQAWSIYWRRKTLLVAQHKEQKVGVSLFVFSLSCGRLCFFF